jgi:sec-independent protein translocase protein TatC
MRNGKSNSIPDPEDMFADTRMSFGDHLEELRTHLWRAIYGFLIAMALCLAVGNYLVKFINAPVEAQLKVFNERAAANKARELENLAQKNGLYMSAKQFEVRLSRPQLRAALGLPPEPAPPPDAQPVLDTTVRAFDNLLEDLNVAYLLNRENLKETRTVVLDMEITDPRFRIEIIKEAMSGRDSLSTLNVTEAFMVYFKVSMIAGVILGSPWIFYQIWAFIAAGLYPHEKRLVNVYLPFSLFLFLAGAAVCQFLVIPKAIEVLLSFNEWMGLQPDLRLSEWLSFAITMPLIFGISFQTPLVMMFVYKIGLIEVATFRKHRRIAWFLMLIFAAVITPTVDVLSCFFLWVPMGFLYELGILLCVMQPNTPFEDVETPEAEEMVEV